MTISGEQLYFLMQVLNDSLKFEMGYDWPFTIRREKRKQFYDALIKEMMAKNEKIKIMD